MRTTTRLPRPDGLDGQFDRRLDRQFDRRLGGQLVRRLDSRRRLLRAAAGGGLLALAAGCGFHLRGSTPMPFKTLYLPAGNTSMAADLRRAFANTNTRLVDSPKDAEARLETLLDTKEKEILAFSSTGTPREYQLRLRYRFRLIDSQEDEWIGPTEIVLRRSVTTSDAQLLAKQQEDVILFQEMQSDLVQQLLRRLAAAKR
ncbi:MAG: LPS assembly lipoprotein LptE [Burkholderiaceae bacterium]